MASLMRLMATAALLLAVSLLAPSPFVAAAAPTPIRGLWFAWGPCNQLAAIGPMYPDEAIDFQMTYPTTFTELRREVGQYDLMVLDSQYIGEAVEDGLILNLNELVSQPEVRFGDFFPGAIETYSEYPAGSKDYWGFPFQADAPYLVYRKDLFAQHGLSAPRDLGEMLSHARYFKNLNDSTVPYGFSSYWCGGTNCYDETSTIYNQFAWMEGGELWDPATYRIAGVANSAANARALDCEQRCECSRSGLHALSLRAWQPEQ